MGTEILYILGLPNLWIILISNYQLNVGFIQKILQSVQWIFSGSKYSYNSSYLAIPQWRIWMTYFQTKLESLAKRRANLKQKNATVLVFLRALCISHNSPFHTVFVSFSYIYPTKIVFPIVLLLMSTVV